MSTKSEQEKNSVMGQPTKYREQYCEEIVTHFQSFERTKTVIETYYDKEGNVRNEKEVEKPLPPPTYSSFANKIGVCLDTLKDWTRAHPDFDRAYKKCKSIQEEFIVSNSMCDIGNTAFSIFMMKNNHNWTDRVEQKVEAKVRLEDVITSSFEGPEGEKQGNESK